MLNLDARVLRSIVLDSTGYGLRDPNRKVAVHTDAVASVGRGQH